MPPFRCSNSECRQLGPNTASLEFEPRLRHASSPAFFLPSVSSFAGFSLPPFPPPPPHPFFLFFLFFLLLPFFLSFYALPFLLFFLSTQNSGGCNIVIFLFLEKFSTILQGLFEIKGSNLAWHNYGVSVLGSGVFRWGGWCACDIGFPSLISSTRTKPGTLLLSLIHIWRCRRLLRCRSRWSPYH